MATWNLPSQGWAGYDLPGYQDMQNDYAREMREGAAEDRANQDAANREAEQWLAELYSKDDHTDAAADC